MGFVLSWRWLAVLHVELFEHYLTGVVLSESTLLRRPDTVSKLFVIALRHQTSARSPISTRHQAQVTEAYVNYSSNR